MLADLLKKYRAEYEIVAETRDELFSINRRIADLYGDEGGNHDAIRRAKDKAHHVTNSLCAAEKRLRLLLIDIEAARIEEGYDFALALPQ